MPLENLPDPANDIDRKILDVEFRSHEHHAQLGDLWHNVKEERFPLVQGITFKLQLRPDQMDGEDLRRFQPRL